ncbi:MAG: MOSC domain-containing protein [Terriglobia bacterium]
MNASRANPVAMVLELARYPVKSMRGEALSAATLTLQGIPEDRRYAFVQAASRSDFPWFTARQLPEMLCYKPAVEADSSGELAVTVTTPGGEKWPVDSDELRRELEERSSQPLFLLRNGRGSYDAAPISIISRQTVARIAEESTTEANPWRFRPNLVVDLQEGGAFEELNWVGRILRIGETARIPIIKVDKRCVIITLDPETAESSPGILRCVAQEHANCAGVYGTVLTAGEVRVGDRVWLEG